MLAPSFFNAGPGIMLGRVGSGLNVAEYGYYIPNRVLHSILWHGTG